MPLWIIESREWREESSFYTPTTLPSRLSTLVMNYQAVIGLEIHAELGTHTLVDQPLQLSYLFLPLRYYRT